MRKTGRGRTRPRTVVVVVYFIVPERKFVVDYLSTNINIINTMIKTR